jgi:tricorn protease
MANNRSYSDAEIFPHAFRTLGLGKIVGEATGGFVIGTYSTKLIDGSTFRLPRTGVFTNKGVNMEKQGVVPDVAVQITPEDWLKGVDTQLTKAVEVVSSDVREWKARKTGGSTGGGTASPAAPSGGGATTTPPSPKTPTTPNPAPTAPNSRIPLAD